MLAQNTVAGMMEGSRYLSPSPTLDTDRFADYESDSTFHNDLKASAEEKSATSADLLNGYPEPSTNESTDLSSSCLKCLRTDTLSENLAKLSLDFNDLTELPESIGTSVPHLRTLSLTGNQLKVLPTSVGDLKHLQELYLNENCLEFLPHTICCLKQLKVLKLTGNEVNVLPADFGELCSLQNLTIDENCLRQLPVTFGLLSNLEVFEANNNTLSCLPASFGRLKRLRIINISENKIETLPANFGDLCCIEFMDLSKNLIEHLPTNFSSCRTLKKLYLDDNVIGFLPKWVSNLPEAVEVSVSNNKMTNKAMDEEFGVTNCGLRRLDVSGNFISSLPDSIGSMVDLEYFHMGSVIHELERRNFQNGNWISRLPKSFCQLTRLIYLRLDENQFLELPPEFGQLVSLEYLDLGQNMLHELPDSFGNLKSLRYCYLSKNHLQLLPPTFGLLSQLEDLRLDNNQIAELPESFEKLMNLKSLDLFNNHLTEIPACLRHFSNLVRLDIEENKFKIPKSEVPMIVKHTKYAPRDPALKDNWRGRPRQDLSDPNSVIEMPEADSSSVDAKEEPEDHVLFSEQQLEIAARRNMSFWRSHDGPVRREKFVRGERSFMDWLSKNKTFGKPLYKGCTEDVSVSERRREKEEDKEESNDEEEEEEDSYTMSYSSRKCDWGSASDNEDNSEEPAIPSWNEQMTPACEENWDEEIDSQAVITNPEVDELYKLPYLQHEQKEPVVDEGQFEDADDDVNAKVILRENNHHPTWQEVHQRSGIHFFAFDLHAESCVKNLPSNQLPIETVQFDDAD